MGFSGGLMLLAVLGFVVLGPRRMQEVFRHVARAKAEWERSSRELKSRFAVEIADPLVPSTRGAALPDSVSPTQVCTMERNATQFDT